MSLLSTILRVIATTAHKLRGAACAPSIRRRLEEKTPAFSANCEFVVFFADPVEQIYQLNQWLVPLEALSESGSSVGVVVMDPFVAQELSRSTKLPILLPNSFESYEEFAIQKNVRGVFYVNNSQANFTALRLTAPTHIHLNHGESNKISMVSNQLKAYDYAFIAGEAARTRIHSVLRRIDDSHLIEIGRPQLDYQVERESVPDNGRIRVLYAPTWEGDSKEMAYSSLTTMGTSVVEQLLGDDRFSVVLRPHPKTGSWSRETLKSLTKLKDMIRKAGELDSHAGHSIDVSSDATLAIANSDIVIADVSAMAMDAVGLNKPVILASSEAAHRQALQTQSTKITIDVLPSIASENLSEICNITADLASGPIPSTQTQLRDYIFGRRSLGTGTARFIRASKSAIDNRSV